MRDDAPAAGRPPGFGSAPGPPPAFVFGPGGGRRRTRWRALPDGSGARRGPSWRGMSRPGVSRPGSAPVGGQAVPRLGAGSRRRSCSGRGRAQSQISLGTASLLPAARRPVSPFSHRSRSEWTGSGQQAAACCPPLRRPVSTRASTRLAAPSRATPRPTAARSIFAHPAAFHSARTAPAVPTRRGTVRRRRSSPSTAGTNP